MPEKPFPIDVSRALWERKEAAPEQKTETMEKQVPLCGNLHSNFRLGGPSDEMENFFSEKSERKLNVSRCRARNRGRHGGASWRRGYRRLLRNCRSFAFPFTPLLLLGPAQQFLELFTGNTFQ
jgi:hypothetical protein